MGDIKFRHETKHYITYSDYLAIRSRLKAIAASDKHADENGFYLIRSLYFDNYNDKALKEKVYGYNSREKFRIRYYNGDDSFIHLEKKSKINGLCNKLSAPITREEVEMLIKGDIAFLKESHKPLFLDLYTKMQYQCMRPRVIVDYLREPFIYVPGNVRITFDTSIKSGLYSTDFFNMKVPKIEATDHGQLLMEVKYDAFLPEIIQMAIQVTERPRTSFSLAVTSNVVLSLGMVGALSIVRFRTAVKEPIEITYLFWAIAAGIVVGAGMFPLAVFGSVMIGVILVLFVNKKTSDNPYILVVNCEDNGAEKNVMNYVNNQVKKSVIKSKTVSKIGIEVTLEVRLKDETTDFVNQISSIKNVNNAVLVSYNGDYMS